MQYISQLTDYWLTVFQITHYVLITAHIYSLEPKDDLRTIAKILNIDPTRLKHIYATAIPWPYFVQIILHLHAPLVFELPDDQSKSKYHVTPTEVGDLKRDPLLICLPDTPLASLLNKHSTYKANLAAIRNSDPPKFRDRNKQKSSSSTTKKDPKRFSTPKWKKKQIVTNQLIIANLLKDFFKTDKSYNLIKPSIPRLREPGFPPIPKATLTYLCSSYGFTMPYWLKIINFDDAPNYLNTAQSLRDHCPVPIRQFDTSNTPFELEKIKFLPGLYFSLRRHFSPLSELKRLFPDSLTVYEDYLCLDKQDDSTCGPMLIYSTEDSFNLDALRSIIARFTKIENYSLHFATSFKKE
jgi:hypothetical protein